MLRHTVGIHRAASWGWAAVYSQRQLPRYCRRLSRLSEQDTGTPWFREWCSQLHNGREGTAGPQAQGWSIETHRSFLIVQDDRYREKECKSAKAKEMIEAALGRRFPPSRSQAASCSVFAAQAATAGIRPMYWNHNAQRETPHGRQQHTLLSGHERGDPEAEHQT